MGLDPDQREVYDDRVSTFVRYGMKLVDAKALAESKTSKHAIHRLYVGGCPMETLRRIVD